MNSALKVFCETFAKQYSVNEAQFIGSGTYAQVFKIFEPKINKFIAIRKVSKTPEVMSDIQKETSISQLLKSVKSQQILEIFEIIQQQDNIWYITEYCEGGSLWETLANSPEFKFSETDSLKVALEIAKGVQQLHSKRITHRDLKPENILFSQPFKPGKQPKLKIADFGLSTCNIIMETVAGTKQYLAPEQAKFGTYTNAVDVWSLGIMLDQMLHGTLFYTGEGHKQVFDKILKVDYEVRSPSLSPQIKQLLLRILKKKAYQRPIIASIIKNIEQILAIDTKQDKPVQPANKIFQRKKTADLEQKKDIQTGKSPFYFQRNQKSRERPKSRNQQPTPKKKETTVDLSKLSKQITSQIQDLQSIKFKKVRTVFNPIYSLTQITEQNPIKLSQVLLQFGYLNTFQSSDKNYVNQISQTPKKIFSEIASLNSTSKGIRMKIKQQIILKIQQHIDGIFDQISL